MALAGVGVVVRLLVLAVVAKAQVLPYPAGLVAAVAALPRESVVAVVAGLEPQAVVVLALVVPVEQQVVVALAAGFAVVELVGLVDQ